MLRNKLEELKRLGWTLDDLIEFVGDLEKIELRENKDVLFIHNREVIEAKKEELSTIIWRILLDIGVPRKLSGYKYISSAIAIGIKDGSSLNVITKVLYPKIAEEYNIDSARVERCIRHAITHVWKYGNKEHLAKYFGDIAYSKQRKPSNSEFLATLVETITANYSFKN